MEQSNICNFKCISRLLTFLVLFFLMGCGSREVEGTPITMSYISAQNNRIVEQKAYLAEKDTEAQLEEVLTLLATAPQKLEYHVPLSQGISVLDTSLSRGHLTLQLSKEYKQLDTLREILTRASLVKSLTQIEGVDRVSIEIDGEPLTDSLGKKTGAMTAAMFIDNAGEEISTYEKVTVRLYFANEEGDELVAVDRSKAYNTNISLDKFVVEELIKGPESTTQGVYPTINPDTKTITTLVKDNTCYVDFDVAFLNHVYQVDAEIVVYSIVNSLCELPGVNRVQISVNGSSDVMFQEILSLKTIFSPNSYYVHTNSD